MVWALIFIVVLWGWSVSRSPQVKKQWHTIFKSSIAMASSIVLLFYLLFTLLDSVHFRLAIHATETKNQQVQYAEMTSLLDLLFMHNIKNTERTYSAPFATHEYAKSIVVDADGVTQQEYLPLKYVSKNDDVVQKSILAIFIGLIISGSLIFGHMLWRKKRGFQSELPWRTAYLTLLFLIVTFTWFYMLSYDYHVLGTDKVGGDVLYHSLKSIRTGVLIGILTTLIMLPVLKQPWSVQTYDCCFSY
jgi:peptide/nickel transport system permease protein